MFGKIKQKIKKKLTKIEYRVEKVPVISGQQLQEKVALISGGVLALDMALRRPSFIMVQR